MFLVLMDKPVKSLTSISWMGKPDAEKGSDLPKVRTSKVLLGSLLCMPFGVMVSEMSISCLRPERNLHDKFQNKRPTALNQGLWLVALSEG